MWEKTWTSKRAPGIIGAIALEALLGVTAITIHRKGTPMSNAAHAKTWPEDSLSDPGPLLPGADAKHLSQRSQDERRIQAGDADLTSKFDIGGLSQALRRLFDRGDDQFLWSLSESIAVSHQARARDAG